MTGIVVVIALVAFLAIRITTVRMYRARRRARSAEARLYDNWIPGGDEDKPGRDGIIGGIVGGLGGGHNSGGHHHGGGGHHGGFGGGGFGGGGHGGGGGGHVGGGGGHHG